MENNLIQVTPGELDVNTCLLISQDSAQETAAIDVAQSSFDETVISIWRQALVENADAVKLGTESYPVINSKAKRLRLVAFAFDGNEIMGIEQNSKTKSRWAAMARAGKKVMQFIQDGSYIAIVADGKVTMYGSRERADFMRRCAVLHRH